jgi:hypothetical protein
VEDQLTMEARIKLVGETSNHWIICKQDFDAPIRSYGFFINSTGQADRRRVVVSIHTDDGPDYFEDEVGDGILEYYQWYHVAVVYDGSNVTTYINGELNGQAALTGSLRQNDKKLTIGGTIHTNGDTINGSIDEVRIWSTARTQADIQDTMDKSLSGDEPYLVGYWNFDIIEDLDVGEDGPDDYFDYSGNGNHLDLVSEGTACGDYNQDGLIDSKDKKAKLDALMLEYENWLNECWTPYTQKKVK